MKHQVAASYYLKGVSHLLDSKPVERYKGIKQLTDKTKKQLKFSYDEPDKGKNYKRCVIKQLF